MLYFVVINDIEKKKKYGYVIIMFKSGTIVKVLLPNVVNCGYDYRLNSDADLGAFVRVTLMNRPYVGVIYGVGDGGVAPEKIKNISTVFPWKLSVADLKRKKKMSEWTLMAPGAVLRLIINVPDAFNDPKTEQLYVYNFDAPKSKMTENRQMVLDAFELNDLIHVQLLFQKHLNQD